MMLGICLVTRVGSVSEMWFSRYAVVYLFSERIALI